MNIEQLVCSRDLAKRLKELGVVQDSLFSWIADHRDGEIKVAYWSRAGGDHVRIASAFTVAELGEMLPQYIDNKFWLSTERMLEANGWEVIKQKVKKNVGPIGTGTVIGRADTEANARAKALQWLIEQGYTNVGDL